MKQLSKEEKVKALKDFVLDDNCLQPLNKWIQNVNFFDVLRSSKTEIRHSNILAWLMDSNGSHGMGDFFIREFVKTFIAENPEKDYNINEWAFINFYNQQVIREWQGTQGKDKLDILMLFEGDDKKHLIAIENKIDSTESGKDESSQTKKYRDKLERDYPEYEKLYIFLTPEKDDPEDFKYWGVMSYEHILKIVEEIVSNMELKERTKFILDNYIEILRRDVVEDKDLIKICNDIYERHREALDLIFENKADEISRIAEAIKNELSKDKNINIDETSGKTYIRFTTNSLNKFIPENNEPNGAWGTKKTYYYWICTNGLKEKDQLEFAFELGGEKGGGELNETSKKAHNKIIKKLKLKDKKPVYKYKKIKSVKDSSLKWKHEESIDENVERILKNVYKLLKKWEKEIIDSIQI